MNGVNYSIKKEALISFLAGVTASYLTLPIWTLRTRVTLAKAHNDRNSTREVNIFIIRILDYHSLL